MRCAPSTGPRPRGRTASCARPSCRCRSSRTTAGASPTATSSSARTRARGPGRPATPFRPGGRVTAGNSAGLTDGATVCLLASEQAADEHGLEPKMRLVSYAFAGVEPELMGLGPVPATRKALDLAGLTLDEIGLFELNEPFAVQVLSWCDGARGRPAGRTAQPVRRRDRLRPSARGDRRAAARTARLRVPRAARGAVRAAALCVGLGMGAALIWENVAAGD